MGFLDLVAQRTPMDGPVLVVEGRGAGEAVRALLSGPPGRDSRILDAPTRDGAIEIARALEEEFRARTGRPRGPFVAVVDRDYESPRDEPTHALVRTWDCHEIENAFLVPEDLAYALGQVESTAIAALTHALADAAREVLPLAAVNAALASIRPLLRFHVREFRVERIPESIEAGIAEIWEAFAAKQHEWKAATEATRERLLDEARRFAAGVRPRIGAGPRPAPPDLPGKDVLHLVLGGRAGERDAILERAAVNMRARGFVPPEILGPLVRARFLEPPKGGSAGAFAR